MNATSFYAVNEPGYESNRIRARHFFRDKKGAMTFSRGKAFFGKAGQRHFSVEKKGQKFFLTKKGAKIMFGLNFSQNLVHVPGFGRLSETLLAEISSTEAVSGTVTRGNFYKSYFYC